jgi:hypothetical protein
MRDSGKHLRLGRWAGAAFAVAAAGAGAQESASAPRAVPALPAGFAATLFAAGLPTPRYPDGALYVGDDAGGRIWKITYRGSAAAR